jgi:hypothetical protein
MSRVSSTVIQDIENMCKAGNASMPYFVFEIRDSNKQGFARSSLFPSHPTFCLVGSSLRDSVKFLFGS